jgi:hypothetical protein
MRKLIFPFIALLVLAQGCQSPTKKKAFDFNQKLTGISDSLGAKGSEMGKELDQAVKARDFARLTMLNKDIVRFIDDKIVEIKNTEDIGGSGRLKSAMIDFLNYEKEFIQEGFGPFEKMDANTTQEEVQSAGQFLLQKSQDEKTHLNKVQEAQRDYAKQNGFRIKGEK